MQWFVDHQEFLENPFYVGGDSCSGMIVPVITQIVAISKTIHICPLTITVTCFGLCFAGLVLCFHILLASCDYAENEIMEVELFINLKVCNFSYQLMVNECLL